jgi:hypothetical protein
MAIGTKIDSTENREKPRARNKKQGSEEAKVLVLQTVPTEQQPANCTKWKVLARPIGMQRTVQACCQIT